MPEEGEKGMLFEGFWSYVHADDKADSGRIQQLAKDISAQFEMISGDSIKIFLDRASIQWGEKWRERINSSLASVAFFVAVLSPRYFMSPECRSELQTFAREAARLCIRELVLPLLYVEVPGLDEKVPKDDLMALVKEYQWEDWRELRFAEVDSEVYRLGVSRLAARLVEANREIEQRQLVSAVVKDSEEFGTAESETPGILDRLARGEEALPQLHEILGSITEHINTIGTIMNRATDDIYQGDARGAGFAARLIIARRTSRELDTPVTGIRDFANRFATTLHDVDQSFRVIIEQAPSALKDNPDSKSELCSFFGSVKYFAGAMTTGLQSVQEMLNGIKPLEAIARDLRPPLRKLRQGLTTMLEAQRIGEEWVELMQATGIDCGENSQVVPDQ